MKRVIIYFFLVYLSTLSLYGQCDSNCVWPGDLNANGIANNLDALAFGFALGATGPARTAPTTDWEAQNAEDWTGVLPFLGANFKHADADGNGVVDDQDQFPISINYNRTNDSFTGLLGNEIEGNDLFVVPQNTVTEPGGTLVLDIHLGSESAPIEDIYGIGFQLQMDTQYVESVNFDFTESWLGLDEEIFAYNKFSDDIDHAAVAITRLDGMTTSGFGKIGRLSIVITDVIIGIAVDTTACVAFPLQFNNVLGINAEEEDLFISAKVDTTQLKHPSQFTVSTSFMNLEHDFKVFPNPSDGAINIINSGPDKIDEVRIFNPLGMLVFQDTFSEQVTSEYLISLPKSIPRGVYYISFKIRDQMYLEKLVLK